MEIKFRIVTGQFEFAEVKIEVPNETPAEMVVSDYRRLKKAFET